MLYVIIGLSVLLFALGFIITEKNAPYLLSGYNMMSKEEQAKFDLVYYLKFLKSFHKFLGISVLIFGLIIYTLSPDLAGLFIGLYPTLAYIYFIIKTKKFVLTSQKVLYRIAIIGLSFIVLFVTFLWLYGQNENLINIHEDKIEISGVYGEIISLDNIQSVESIKELPALKYRLNGFAMSEIKKGYFKTEADEKIKLIINNKSDPIFKIVTRDGSKIFLSSKLQLTSLIEIID